MEWLGWEDPQTRLDNALIHHINTESVSPECAADNVNIPQS